MMDKKNKDENDGAKGAVGEAIMLNAETIEQMVSQTVATMAALQQHSNNCHQRTMHRIML